MEYLFVNNRSEWFLCLAFNNQRKLLKKAMLEKIALAIHWISFIFGVVLGAFLISASIFFEISSNQRFFTFLFGLFSMFSCSGLGWLARFVLTGKVHFFPWKNL